MIVEVDGRSAHAATGGVELQGDGPVLVLLHGAGMDATVWQQQTRFLAHRGIRAVAVDLPGHGRSEGEPLATITDMADWVARFLEAGSLGPTHVAGHSMGSFVALELARRHPSSVRSLLLLGTAIGMPVHPDLLQASEDQLDRAAALMASWGHAKPAHIGLNPTPGQWMIGGARALVELSEAGSLTVDFHACASYEVAGEAAASAGCPVTIVVGRGDRMTPPKSAAKLIEHVPDGLVDVVELAGVGHMMMLEDPRSVRQLMLDVVSGT